MKVSLRWLKNLSFEAKNENDLRYFLDSVKENGSPGLGPTPMETVLSALAGCTGMDVVSILKKMRTPVDSFKLEVSAERADEHPKVFTEINLIYRLDGIEEPEKAMKAIRLSQEKYCSVGAMLKEVTNYQYKVIINGEEQKI